MKKGPSLPPAWDGISALLLGKTSCLETKYKMIGKDLHQLRQHKSLISHSLACSYFWFFSVFSAIGSLRIATTGDNSSNKNANLKLIQKVGLS